MPAPLKPPRRDKPEMTLDRALSRAGIASRTAAAALIAAGRVRVGGVVVRDPARWVAPGREVISLDRRPLRSPRRLYFALHKPVGFITSHGDPQGRPTIYDLLGERREWLFPVGRLDLDTSGLLFLTNDSTFAESIANPGSKVPKTYRVKVAGNVGESELARLRQGLDIGRDERTAPAEAEWLRGNERTCWLDLTLREGKNRQVRRMIEALGREVLALQRIRIGRLELGSLPPGRMRAIRPEQVDPVFHRTVEKSVQKIAAGRAPRG